MQILPAIDIRGGKCVRLRQGDYSQETIFGDDPVAVARRWADEGATRLHLVDLDGARAGKPVNHEVVRRVVQAVGVPCQLGGGIRDDESARFLLESIGVERVIVGTQALKEPDWFRALVERYPQRIVLGIDARNSLVATEGWLDVSTTPAVDLARKYAGLPLAALVYTNIANDGMMQGIDEATIDSLVQLADLGFATIASGGVTSVSDVRRLAKAAQHQPNLVGAIIGRALYEGTITVRDAIAASRAHTPV
jgi:phosphoribosylformimino-5-aminoimidazole carboxamide ribotide isomerase